MQGPAALPFAGKQDVKDKPGRTINIRIGRMAMNAFIIMKHAIRLGWGFVFLFFLASGPVLADAVSGTTAVTFSSNPVTLVPGNDVTITTTTTSTDVHTSPPTTAALIDAGKVTIEMATDGLNNPVPAASVVSWVGLNAPGVNPVAGVTSLAVDLDSLGFVPGTKGGFRAHYVGVNINPGAHRISTHSSPGVDLTAASSCTPGVNVGATLASGKGMPNPGDSGPWTFGISVQNCTGVNLTGVKVQGGANGWAYVGTNSITTAPDSSDVNNVTVKTVGKKEKNSVITWIVDILDGATKTIFVTVNGPIPCSAPDGEIRFISGEWSAVYDDGSGPQKSEYSGRVSLTVDASAVNESCQ